MKKSILTIFSVLFFFELYSQNIEAPTYLLTNVGNTIALGTVNVLDPYLSPLPYNGFNIGSTNDNFRFLSNSNSKVITQERVIVNFGTALNPSSTASMMMGGMNIQRGIYYLTQPLQALKIMVGGAWDAEYELRYVARNTNNPVNMDFSTNLNITAMANYSFALFKRNAQVRLSVQSPMVGYMFAPPIGLSYYEMSLGNYSNTLHLTTLHNKHAIQSKLLFYFPFNKSEWHIGAGYNALNLSVNNTVFQKEYLNILIGSNLDMIYFAGRKKLPPSNFKRVFE